MTTHDDYMKLARHIAPDWSDEELSSHAPEQIIDWGLQLAQGVDIPRLPVGTSVTKVIGYPFPGTVVSAFHTLSGQERFVVEATGEDYRGMLHIFNGDQLRAKKENQP